MTIRTLQAGVAALCLGLAAPAFAQDVPVPRPNPAEPAAPAPAEAPPAADAPPVLPEGTDAPLPEARPQAPAGAPGGEEAPVAAADPPPPAGDAPEPAENGPAEGEPDAPAEPPAPAPAYVPPDEARTRPEPTAPETPDMSVTPAQTVEAAAAVEDAVACERELEARGAEFTVGATIADGRCGVLRPVAMTRSSSGVAISPPTQFLCRTALALDIWLAESVGPAAAEHFDGAAVEALGQASTYVCRDRASEGRISEHSRGSAVDIGAFTLTGGRRVAVEEAEPGSAEDRFAAAIRRAACGPFLTVIGPGTDADHDTHLHLDIAARSNGATYCR